MQHRGSPAICSCLHPANTTWKQMLLLSEGVGGVWWRAEGSWGGWGEGGLVSSRRRWPPEVMLCSQSTDGEHRRAPDLTPGELLCGGGQDGWVSGGPRGHSHPAPYLQAPVCRCENGCCSVTSEGGLHSERERDHSVLRQCKTHLKLLLLCIERSYLCLLPPHPPPLLPLRGVSPSFTASLLNQQSGR